MNDTKPNRILLVDEDAVASSELADCLARHGYQAVHARGAEQAINAIDRASATQTPPFAVVIVDIDHAGPEGGLSLMRQLRELRPGLVPIVTSGFRKLESAVKSMRSGAADFLVRPVNEAELLDAIARAMQTHLLLSDGLHDSTAKDSEDQDAPGSTSKQQRSIEPDEGDGNDWSPMPLAEAMREPERRILLAALQANGWNRQETARQLDINRTTLYKKIRQHRLDEPPAA